MAFTIGDDGKLDKGHNGKSIVQGNPRSDHTLLKEYFDGDGNRVREYSDGAKLVTDPVTGVFRKGTNTRGFANSGVSSSSYKKIRKELCGDETYKILLERLINIACKNKDDNTAMKAIRELMDREWGKSKEHVINETSVAASEELKKKISELFGIKYEEKDNASDDSGAS